MNLNELKDLKDLACKAALKAGKVIQSVGGATSIKKKSAGFTFASQVVTDVDLQAQRALFEVIEPTLEKWDLALLSEEKEDDGSRFEKEYFWAIDPLDGTLAFIEESDGFAVSIALISRDGVPQIGVVYDPVNDELYEAIKHNGAFCNGNPLHIPPAAESRQCHFIVDRTTESLLQKGQLRELLVQQINEIGLSLTEVFTHYGAVMNVCNCLEHPMAFFLKVPKEEEGGGCIWDYGATACIYKEAGGVVTDCRGQELALNSPHSVYMNEGGVLFASTKELSLSCVELMRSKLTSVGDEEVGL